MTNSIRAVVRWQLAATFVLASLSALTLGRHAAVSAGLGGAISVVSGLVFAHYARFNKGESATGVLVVALKAELIRIALMVCLLVLVATLYREVVLVGLIGSFLVTVVIFTMGLFVRET